MNVNSFCSKINLPKFCNKLGYTDYQFTRIPTFGWVAYNKDKTFIGNIFDLVSPKDQDILYKSIVQNRPEYLEFDLAYSESSDKRLQVSRMEMQLWTAAYAFARKEFDTYRTTYSGRKVYLKDILIAHGLNGLVKNRVGVITTALMEKFNMLPWPKRDVRGKLLIPSFYTPSHICSLEYASWDDLGQFYPLYLNDEKGWYGNIKKSFIVNDIKELSTTAGITWDSKADFWLSDTPTILSEFLDTDTNIRIWTEAKHASFDKNPLKNIVDLGKASELKNYVGKLTYQQLLDIEQITGEKLSEYWKQSREQQVQIGDRIFTKRDNCYCIYKRGNLQKVTNFAIDIEKIVKRENKFIRIGYLHFGTNTVPFEMEEKYFNSSYMFHKGIKDKFLRAGLGIPLIHQDFSSKALLIIDSFNAGTKIVIDDDVKVGTSTPPN